MTWAPRLHSFCDSGYEEVKALGLLRYSDPSRPTFFLLFVGMGFIAYHCNLRCASILTVVFAGNTCVCKPSELTSVTAYMFCKVLKDAGLQCFIKPY